MAEEKRKKVAFCIPTVRRPFQVTLDSLRDSVPVLEGAGWDHGAVSEIGNPYISAARAAMLRKAIDAKADVIMFIDHDVSWKPHDLLKLLDTEGDVVAGTYRFKTQEEKYMGQLIGTRPQVRESDGAILAEWAPAGFLKVTRNCVNAMMAKYPELVYGENCNPSFDLFNHGAYKGQWWGEDAAFGRRWTEAGGKVWIVPDMDISHWGADGTEYMGNFHRFMLRQPGGSESDNPQPPEPVAELSLAARREAFLAQLNGARPS